MQQREMFETRMSETMQMTDVRVVSCKIVSLISLILLANFVIFGPIQCAYTWHGQSDLCKSAGHQVNWHKGTRRYFRCVDCRRRTIAYDTPLPTRACEQCKSTNYERVGMRDERRVKDSTGNTALKIRGDEVPFVNR
jgi:ribosomal protein S27E